MHTTTGVGYSKFVESFRSSPFLCHPCHSLQHQSDHLSFFPYAKALFQKQIQSKVRDYISKPRNHSFIHFYLAYYHHHHHHHCYHGSIIPLLLGVVVLLLGLLCCCCVCCAATAVLGWGSQPSRPDSMPAGCTVEVNSTNIFLKVLKSNASAKSSI